MHPDLVRAAGGDGDVDQRETPRRSRDAVTRVTAVRARRAAVEAVHDARPLLPADAIIALRCCRLGGRFEDFWERRSAAARGEAA
jgi:hypothetical protein